MNYNYGYNTPWYYNPAQAVNENLNPKNQEVVSREEFNNLSDNVNKLQKIIDDLNN